MEEKLEIFLWSLLFVGFALLYLASRKAGSSRISGKSPPGPTPLPFIGNLLQLSQNPNQSLAKLARIHGPVMGLKLGSVYTIVVTSPSTARQVLQTKDRSFCGRHVPDVIGSQGHHEVSVAWMPPNQSWKSLRTLLKTHLFNHRSLDASQSIRRRKVQDLITFIKGQGGKAIYIGRATFCTMLNLVSTAFLSLDIVDANSDEAGEFKDVISMILEEVGSPNISDFFPLLAPLDLQGRRRRFAASYKKMNAIFEQIIRRRLEGEKTLQNHDVLDVLLNSSEEDGTKFSIHTIKSLLTDFFVAGGDTSSATVEWAMAELLRRPELMEKVRLEIETSVGFEKEVEESDLPKLPFLHAVLKETLRLHPVGPLLLPHKAEESMEIDGYTVPQGSRLFVNVWAIGRDESIWENPDCFMPERFMGEQGAAKDIDFQGQHFEFLPFGSGRRMCPGMPLATRMVQLMLASLIQSFDWKLPEGMAPVDLNFEEKFGLSLVMASPLKASGIPRFHS